MKTMKILLINNNHERKILNIIKIYKNNYLVKNTQNTQCLPLFTKIKFRRILKEQEKGH